jgi:hypothetical protein
MYDELNNDVKEWAGQMAQAVKAAGAGEGVTHRDNSPSRGASLQKIKSKVSFVQDRASKISIGFPRTLIYTTKGAGKGIGGRKGSRWLNAKGEARKTNPKSLNKLGSGNRQVKDFINKALDGPQGVETLGDIVARDMGEIVVNNIFIK